MNLIKILKGNKKTNAAIRNSLRKEGKGQGGPSTWLCKFKKSRAVAGSKVRMRQQEWAPLWIRREMGNTREQVG